MNKVQLYVITIYININIDYTIGFTDQENLTDTLKTDISDHFPIFTISMKHKLDSSNKKVIIRKRVINEVSIIQR